MLKGAPGHTGIEGLLRVLHNSYAAAPLNGVESGGAIIQRACQHYSNYSRAIRQGRRAKERIDGGPVPVFLRAAYDTDMPARNYEMMIRRCYVDAPRSDLFIVLRV